MTDSSKRWDAQVGSPEVVVCYGCGNAIEEFEAQECPECGELFCSDACQDGHDCFPQGDSDRE